MQAVAQGSSEAVLRHVDRLISDGQNPSHFARQMVRFLRNTIVAKIAGGESSLLQISGDERQRVTRVAELFSEEDLARHLQIMLRTHSELGYRQEQRFHLELGLLKLAHAQRLLPIEQLLSDAGVTSTSASRLPGKTFGGSGQSQIGVAFNLTSNNGVPIRRLIPHARADRNRSSRRRVFRDKSSECGIARISAGGDGFRSSSSDFRSRDASNVLTSIAGNPA